MMRHTAKHASRALISQMRIGFRLRAAAAHCTNGLDLINKWNAKAYLDTVTYGSSTTTSKFSQVIQHPNYNPDTTDNDYALLKLGARP